MSEEFVNFLTLTAQILALVAISITSDICGWRAPGFLVLLLSANFCMCVCVCTCVPTPEAINN